MTCTTCPKRNKCIELCEEAEKFVSQDDKGHDVLSDHHYFSISVTTNFDYKALMQDIEERKTDELVYYFQQIHTMKDSKKKAILSMVFCGIPLTSIARYTKTDIRQVYRELGK